MTRFLVSAMMVALLLIPACTGGGDDVAATPESDVEETFPGAVTADPDHYAVEFENDLVRVLRITYPPLGRSVMHSHPANCTVDLAPGRTVMTFPDGSTEPGAESEVGQSGCNDSVVHLPENAGQITTELIAFELKGRGTFDNDPRGDPAPSASGVPNGIVTNPGVYVTEFENDIVRLVRVSAEAGAESVMHSHEAGCTVFVTGGTFSFISESGETTTDEPLAGTVTCGDAQVHQSSNVGDTSAEVVLLELKGRATFE